MVTERPCLVSNIFSSAPRHLLTALPVRKSISKFLWSSAGLFAAVAVLCPGAALAQTPGTVQAFTPTTPTTHMAGITKDASGNVYVSDNGGGGTPVIYKGVLAGGTYSGTALTITTGPSLVQPYGLAVDSSGALYIANGVAKTLLKATPAGGTNYTTAVLATTTAGHLLGVAVDPAGDVFYTTDTSAYEIPRGSTTPVQIGTGFGFAYNITVDGTGNVYVADLNGSTIYKLTPASGPASYTQSALTIPGVQYPESAASDAFGNLYITNYGSSELIEAVLSNGTYTTFNIQAQSGDAYDYIAPSGVVYTVASNTATVYTFTPNSHVFVANSGGTVSSYSESTGSAVSTSVSGGGIGLAVDNGGNVWSITSSGTGVTQFAPAGSATATYTPSGISGAAAIAIDGAGSVWLAQGGGGSLNNVYELTNAGTVVSPTGFAQAGGISQPASLAVDTAGSLWVSNSGNNTVTEVIGVAAPVATPIVTATPGARP